MSNSYGDDVFDGGAFPFVVGAFIVSFLAGTICFHVGFDAGKSAGRQELLQEFNKTGWYYDERAKEFWRKGEK